MKLLIDMNLSPRWVALLEGAGFEAVHWSTIGQAAARDAEVMRWAAANDYVVVTHDLDFSAIGHAGCWSKCGADSNRGC